MFYNYSFLAVLHLYISMSIVFLNLFLRRLHNLSHLPNLLAPLTIMKHILMTCLTSTFSYIFNAYSHDYTNTNLKLTCLHLWLSEILVLKSKSLTTTHTLMSKLFSNTSLNLFAHLLVLCFWTFTNRVSNIFLTSVTKM